MVAVGSLTANIILRKFLEQEKGPPKAFSWFQSCCGWLLRLTENHKFVIAVANLDRNSGYEKSSKSLTMDLKVEDENHLSRDKCQSEPSDYCYIEWN